MRDSVNGRTSFTYVYRKDFDIMFGTEEVSISVFQLLGVACRELMSLSTRVKKGRSQMHLQASTALNRIVYHRILWSEHCYFALVAFPIDCWACLVDFFQFLFT